jgi:hypothetical protein
MDPLTIGFLIGGAAAISDTLFGEPHREKKAKNRALEFKKEELQQKKKTLLKELNKEEE